MKRHLKKLFEGRGTGKVGISSTADATASNASVVHSRSTTNVVDTVDSDNPSPKKVESSNQLQVVSKLMSKSVDALFTAVADDETNVRKLKTQTSEDNVLKVPVSLPQMASRSQSSELISESKRAVSTPSPDERKTLQSFTTVAESEDFFQCSWTVSSSTRRSDSAVQNLNEPDESEPPSGLDDPDFSSVCSNAAARLSNDAALHRRAVRPRGQRVQTHYLSHAKVGAALSSQATAASSANSQNQESSPQANVPAAATGKSQENAPTPPPKPVVNKRQVSVNRDKHMTIGIADLLDSRRAFDDRNGDSSLREEKRHNSFGERAPPVAARPHFNKKVVELPESRARQRQLSQSDDLQSGSAERDSSRDRKFSAPDSIPRTSDSSSADKTVPVPALRGEQASSNAAAEGEKKHEFSGGFQFKVTFPRSADALARNKPDTASSAKSAEPEVRPIRAGSDSAVVKDKVAVGGGKVAADVAVSSPDKPEVSEACVILKGSSSGDASATDDDKGASESAKIASPTDHSKAFVPAGTAAVSSSADDAVPIAKTREKANVGKSEAPVFRKIEQITAEKARKLSDSGAKLKELPPSQTDKRLVSAEATGESSDAADLKTASTLPDDGPSATGTKSNGKEAPKAESGHAALTPTKSVPGRIGHLSTMFDKSKPDAAGVGKTEAIVKDKVPPANQDVVRTSGKASTSDGSKDVDKSESVGKTAAAAASAPDQKTVSASASTYETKKMGNLVISFDQLAKREQGVDESADKNVPPNSKANGSEEKDPAVIAKDVKKAEVQQGTAGAEPAVGSGLQHLKSNDKVAEPPTVAKWKREQPVKVSPAADRPTGSEVTKSEAVPKPDVTVAAKGPTGADDASETNVDKKSTGGKADGQSSPAAEQPPEASSQSAFGCKLRPTNARSRYASSMIVPASPQLVEAPAEPLSSSTSGGASAAGTGTVAFRFGSLKDRAKNTGNADAGKADVVDSHEEVKKDSSSDGVHQPLKPAKSQPFGSSVLPAPFPGGASFANRLKSNGETHKVAAAADVAKEDKTVSAVEPAADSTSAPVSSARDKLAATSSSGQSVPTGFAIKGSTGAGKTTTSATSRGVQQNPPLTGANQQTKAVSKEDPKSELVEQADKSTPSAAAAASENVANASTGVAAKKFPFAGRSDDAAKPIGYSAKFGGSSQKPLSAGLQAGVSASAAKADESKVPGESTEQDKAAVPASTSNAAPFKKFPTSADSGAKPTGQFVKTAAPASAGKPVLTEPTTKDDETKTAGGASTAALPADSQTSVTAAKDSCNGSKVEPGRIVKKRSVQESPVSSEPEWFKLANRKTRAFTEETS